MRYSVLSLFPRYYYYYYLALICHKFIVFGQMPHIVVLRVVHIHSG